MTFSLDNYLLKRLGLLTGILGILTLLMCSGNAEIEFASSNGDKGPEALHQPFAALLQKYVVKTRFDYEGIFRDKADLQQLYDYVDQLETQRPGSWSKPAALAYWINLYNAATLELVLQNYPVKSIKDIGSLFSSPWSKKVVTVEGNALTLNNIENDIIRKQFDDARIHFALNCASIGCPTLAKTAYTANVLDAQMEAATHNALNSTNWVDIGEDRLLITKIFDWYGEDFTKDAGSVRAFIARYRPDDREVILNPETKLLYKDYDWKLNIAEKR